MKGVLLAAIAFLACCNAEVVKDPARPKGETRTTPEASPEVEAKMTQNCSPTSHFGAKRATEVLQMEMRWVNPTKEDGSDCSMGPMSDTRPYFWLDVVDYADHFAEFTA